MAALIQLLKKRIVILRSSNMIQDINIANIGFGSH